MPDKTPYPSSKMRGSQEALLFDSSENSLTSSRTSINQFELDHHHHTGSNQTELGFTCPDLKCNERIQSDYIPCSSMQESGGGGGGVLFNFQRRMSMQLGSSSYGGCTPSDNLRRLNSQKSRTRRGSIPCLSASSSTSVIDNTSSQTCLIKSSHTAPDPFPELLASPPPPSSSSSMPSAISHGRSQSSCVDDRLSGPQASNQTDQSGLNDTDASENCNSNGVIFSSSSSSSLLEDSSKDSVRRNTFDSSYNHRPNSSRRNGMEKQISLGSAADANNAKTNFTFSPNATHQNSIGGSSSRALLINSCSSSSINSNLAMEPIRNSYVHPSLIASKVRQIVQQSQSNPSSPSISRRHATSSPTQQQQTLSSTQQQQSVAELLPVGSGHTNSDARKRSPSESPTGSVGRASPDR